jgi:hypothetical protein
MLERNLIVKIKLNDIDQLAIVKSVSYIDKFTNESILHLLHKPQIEVKYTKVGRVCRVNTID